MLIHTPAPLAMACSGWGMSAGDGWGHGENEKVSGRWWEYLGAVFWEGKRGL